MSSNTEVGSVVYLSRRAVRDLKVVPRNIRDKFELWVEMVENCGIYAARKLPSYHDEGLMGKRKGQRSVRLNKAYRLFYKEHKGEIHLVEVLEVNKHEY